jgi:hypothetical protein
MSCSLTVDAVRNHTKTVTRRNVDTWETLKAGDRLTLIEKGMGLAKGAKQIVLAEVEIVDVRVEPLVTLWHEEDAVEKEGITSMSPNLFAYWWAEKHGFKGCKNPTDLAPILVRRIEWRYVTGPKIVDLMADLERSLVAARAPAEARRAAS